MMESQKVKAFSMFTALKNNGNNSNVRRPSFVPGWLL